MQRFDYSNICFWREWPASVVSLTRTQPQVSDHLDQLACQMLVQMIQSSVSQQDIEEVASKILRNVTKDTTETCRHFIDRSYDRLQNHLYVGSFVDAYDIFSAALVIIYLIHSSTSGSYQQHLASIMDVVNKCSTILAAIAERFKVFRSFQRVLSSISNHLMTRTIPYAQVRHP